MTEEIRVNLGANDDHKAGFLSVNLKPPADVVADLCLRWPWDDGSVSEIYAKDVFEHLYYRHGEIDGVRLTGNAGKIWVLNEAWRVLKPGGRLEFLVPACHMKDGRVNLGAFADPTHVSFWTIDDQYYFCDEWADPKTGERGRLGPDYGIQCMFHKRVWELQEYGAAHERRSKLHAIWEAVK